MCFVFTSGVTHKRLRSTEFSVLFVPYSCDIFYVVVLFIFRFNLVLIWWLTKLSLKLLRCVEADASFFVIYLAAADILYASVLKYFGMRYLLISCILKKILTIQLNALLLFYLWK